MSGNTFGKLFTVTTFGESHGTAIGCIVDGCPSKLKLKDRDIQFFLDKRKPGLSKYVSQRKEQDKVKILSGVFKGLTIGSPIALLIYNHDCKSTDYKKIKTIFRPGHADYTYYHKYKFIDYRGGGRSSARETATRVAAGAIARIFLYNVVGITIIGYLEQIGNLVLKFNSEKEIYKNPFFCPNMYQIKKISNMINLLIKNRDSIGAKIKIIVYGVPIGLGSPIFDKLDSALAYAIMSINAVKGIEIGSGFDSIRQFGSENRDQINKNGFINNNSGGILGGISTGQPIEIGIAIKPTSSIAKPAKTINIYGKERIISITGRHDPCIGIRAVPVAEAMVALVLMDYYLQYKAYK